MIRSGSRARRPARGRGAAVLVALLALLGLLALSADVGSARPAKASAVTVTFLAYVTSRPGLDPQVQNFEHAYPNIKVDVTYAPTVTALGQIETTELTAGNAPDLLSTGMGCGSTLAPCKLGKAGDLAPMQRKSWAKRQDPLVTSLEKYGQALVTYNPTVQFDGLWTNDTLFRKLGLKVPQTFPQLLAVCQTAKRAGTIPLLLAAQGSTVVELLVEDIALTTVYAKDTHWTRELKAGKVTFEGTAGWHQALQELVDMKNAGCFEPGPAAVTAPGADAQFAQGHTLMYVDTTGHKGLIDQTTPQFDYSQNPFPAARDQSKTVVELTFAVGVGINAHTSAQNQAAAQSFVDFIARPDQDAVRALINGGLSQAQFAHGRFPPYLSSFVPLFKRHRYSPDPRNVWWNADVGNALTTYGTGLITGQTSVDDVLKAMDTAWKRGPS